MPTYRPAPVHPFPMSQQPPSDSTGTAIAFLLFGVAGGLGLDLCAKTLLADYGLAQFVFLRSIFGLLIFLAMMRRFGGFDSLKTKVWPWHLLRHKSFMLHQVNHVSSGEFPGTMPHSRLWIFSDDSGSNQHAWTIQPALRPDPVDNSELIDYQVLALSDKRSDRAEAMFGFGEIASSIKLLWRRRRRIASCKVAGDSRRVGHSRD